MSYSASRLTLYAILSALEEDLRSMVRTYLSGECSPSDLLGTDVWDKAIERLERDLQLGDRTPDLDRVLFYVDFPDVFKTLNSHRAKLPGPIGQRIKDITPWLEKLVPIRNRVAHSRPLNFDDLATTTALAEDLVKGGDGLWPELRSTISKLNTDPSFVLGLEIRSLDDPTDDRHNLPTPDFDETGFVGRKQQVTDLIKLCLGPYPVITIVGDGGVGKTALALKVAYDILDLPECPFDAVVWTTSKTTQLTANDIVTIEGAICDSLGMLRNVADHLAGSDATRNPIEEVLQYLKEFRILLILDNLETVLDDRIRNFVGSLPAGSKVLMTSRIGLGAFEYPVKLEPMDASEAVLLVRALAKIRGVHTLSRLPNDVLKTYCEQMKCNPGFIKWFVSAIQVGKRPEEVLDRPDMFLDFCMSNVYNYLAADSKQVIRSMLVVPGRHSQAELAFLNQMEVVTLQRALQQLLTTNMVKMTSVPKGSSFESHYDVSDLARAYLHRHHPTDTDEYARITKRRQQMVSAAESISAEGRTNPYSPTSLTMRSSSDRIVAKYLLDAFTEAKRSNFPRAEELLANARQLAPEYFEVHRIEAAIMVLEQNIPAARTAYEAAIELEPGSAPLRLWYGRFLMRHLDDTETALTHFRVGFSADRNSVEIQFELARAYLYLKDFKNARDAIDSLLSRVETADWKRLAYDLKLQYLQRLADNLCAQRDYAGALTCLNDLKQAYTECPTNIRDGQMAERLRKAVLTAHQCAHNMIPESDRRLAMELFDWLREESGVNVTPPPASGTNSSHQGQVVRLSVGFGFIRSNNGQEFLFNRESLVRPGDWSFIDVGAPVHFTVTPTPRGLAATGVSLDRNPVEVVAASRLSPSVDPVFHGTIARLNVSFGFIAYGGKREIFFHKNELVRPSDWVKLKPGDLVSFVIGDSPKGPAAKKVDVLS